MAHLVILASIPPDRIEEVTSPQDISRLATRIGNCSHFLVTVCPEVAPALDGGVPLETNMWHPIRGPAVYPRDSVPTALAILEETTEQQRSRPGEYAAWACGELSRAADLFRHAKEQGEAVISMLDLTRPGPKRFAQPRDSKPARHPNLTFLIACAIIAAGMLVENNVQPGIGWEWLGKLSFLTAIGLVIVPPFRRQGPWFQRFCYALLRLFCWALFGGVTAYVFGISPR